MADNYLENQYEQFLKRKKELELKKKMKKKVLPKPQKPDSNKQETGK